MADILEFLMTRIDPELNLPPDVDQEQDRIYFVKIIAETMVPMIYQTPNSVAAFGTMRSQ